MEDEAFFAKTEQQIRIEEGKNEWHIFSPIWGMFLYFIAADNEKYAWYICTIYISSE